MLHVPSDHIWRPDIVLYNKYSTLFFPSLLYHVVFLLLYTYPFQRVSDTNSSKKPDTLVVTHLFFHVKQKKTCIKLVFLKVLSSIWYLERHFRSVKETLVILTQLAKFRKSSNINKKYSEVQTYREHIVWKLQKCRIWIIEIWHFQPIFVQLKVTCLVKMDHFCQLKM